MKKIGIIMDSFSCLSEKEASELGFYFIPLITEIDEQAYLDGVDIDRLDLLKKMSNSDNIKTSLPYMATFEKIFEDACSKYDEVIYLPISPKLSSTANVASTFLDKYKNLHIINNSLVGDQLIEVAQFAIKHFEKHQNIELLIEKIKEIDEKSIVFILPQNIKYLIKGGRVSALKKFLLGALSKMKLTPYIKFDKTGAAIGGIGRGPKGAIKQIVAKFKSFTKSKNNNWLDEYNFYVINGIDEEFNQMAIDAFKEYNVEFKNIRSNSTVIAIHTGPDAHGYCIMPNLDKWNI